MFVLDLAERYLNIKNLVIAPNKYKLAYFNNSFHLYNGSYWKPLEEKEIRNDLIKQIRDKRLTVGETFNLKNIDDCLKALESITTLEEVNLGSYVDIATPSNNHLIPVKNGILRVECDLGVLKTCLESHTPEFLSPYALPYDFDKSRECPTWIQFLNDILPSPEIFLLQEWFGYQLVPITLAQKFMIMNGLGANGKSVVSLVMRLMLGNENVSAVPLQGFRSDDRFSLAATVNKLANIVTETDELKFFPTGTIKSFTAGDEFQIERKFKDAYFVKPTARLTFATNSLPPFKDKSDGLSRRLLLINFLKQILDESKQDKRLVDEAFWLGSGELSGILNWSLEGLKRLMANSWQFTIPDSVYVAMADYSRELNPIMDFLSESVEVCGRGEYHTATLYSRYVEYCRRSGFTAENKIVFGKSVGRYFKGVIRQSKHSKNENGINARVWLGIRQKNHAPWDITRDELEHLENIRTLTQNAQITQINSVNLIPESKKSVTINGKQAVVYESLPHVEISHE